ncbi:MAG TPA: hypothetical protein ENJ33_07685 [Thiothrix sp.]|nr:hypothetical protein [Thiothrix sp.]
MTLKKNSFFSPYIRYWLGIFFLCISSITFSATPTINLPTVGSTLESSARFSWNYQEMANYWMTIGSSPEASDIADSGIMLDDNWLVTLVPSKSKKLYVRLWYKAPTDNEWEHIDAIYKSATLPNDTSLVISPTPNSIISSNTITFEINKDNEKISTWDRLALTELPEFPNTLLYFKRNLGATSSHTITDLQRSPHRYIYAHISVTLTNGERKNARIRYRTYGIPYLTAPKTGSTLSSNKMDLQWINNNIAIEEYSLKVGTKPEGDDIFSRSSLPSNMRSFRVHNLPEDGKSIFVRLGYKTEGNWKFIDNVYKAHNKTTNISPFIQCLFQCKEDRRGGASLMSNSYSNSSSY